MIRFLLLATALCLLPAPISHSETLAGPIPADVLRIVDGDTIQVRAHIWLGQQLDIMVRLEGIDAPETLRPRCPAERRMADLAKTEVQAMIGERILLHNVHRGKYAGRVIASASLPDGVIIGDHLLSKGLAVTYGAPKPWCVETAVATGPASDD